jgi:conjugal transfer mating pair stabilization protein TraN
MVKSFRVFLLLMSFSLNAKESKQSFKEQGKNYAIEQTSLAKEQLKTFDAKDLYPKETHTPFDAEQARGWIEEKKIPQDENYQFLTSEQVLNNQKNSYFHADEDFLKNSEKIFSAVVNEESATQESQSPNETSSFSIEVCQEAGSPFLISLNRHLQVSISNVTENVTIKKCKKHHTEEKHLLESNAKKAVKHFKEQFEKDPTIQWHQEGYEDPGFGHRYVAWAKWKHIDDATTCEDYRKKKRKVSKKISSQAQDQWIDEDPILANAVKQPNYSLVSKQCTDTTPFKTIEGLTIERPCWQEKLTYVYQYPKTYQCEFLKKKQCRQIKQQCVHQTEQGCALWELTFQCMNPMAKPVVSMDLTDEFTDQIKIEPNQSFANVYSQLAIFQEVKKEIELSQAHDATTLELFKGKKMTCSRSVAENLMYDCCFKHAGLAKQAGLTSCSAEELGLADMREKGLCHYVGHYEEKFLKLWKSRDQHVYCAYPTKIARIIQEEGKKQLGLSWGDPETTLCEGLPIDLLSKIDFTKLNLDELIEEVPHIQAENIEMRLESFREKLNTNIENSEYKR